jgi:single-stranded-DNA-specific exonuclease
MKWIRNERPNQQKAIELSGTMPYTAEVIEYLLDHGCKNRWDIERRISFKEENLRKVSSMKDAPAFVNRVVQAVNQSEPITVYGDYDGDGVMGTTIVVWVMRWLGVKHVNYFINNRFAEGYGLNEKGLKHLLELYPDTKLIITLDNGIAAAEGIAYAKSCGIDVVVSDHHEVRADGIMPDCPTVDEYRTDEDAEAREKICGAELIRRLMVEAVKSLGKEKDLHDRLETLYGFSGFATISDHVAMTDANHWIAREGLRMIAQQNYPCWKALKDAADAKNVNSETIGFYYAPMINAASRITGEASTSVELCISENPEQAGKFAAMLKDVNEQRRRLSHWAADEAKRELDENGHKDDDFLIVHGTDWNIPAGVAGLVCSSIQKTYESPIICLSGANGSDIVTGSGRSVGDFNLKEALDKCSDLLIKYGGHAGACGLTMDKKNVEALRERLNVLAKGIRGESGLPVTYIENPDSLSMVTADQMDKMLAPYGPGFEEPVYAITGVDVDETHIGLSSPYTPMKNDHVRFPLSYRGKDGEIKTIACLYFSGKETMDSQAIAENSQIAVAGRPAVNVFNGKVNYQFQVRDVKKI